MKIELKPYRDIFIENTEEYVGYVDQCGEVHVSDGFQADVIAALVKKCISKDPVKYRGDSGKPYRWVENFLKKN